MKLWSDPVNNPATNLTTLQTFDVAGNLTKSVDQRGVEKDFAYNDAINSYTLPISITHYPVVGATTPSFVESFVYDYNIQKPISYKDFNANLTTFAYLDNLDRATTMTRPDVGARDSL